MPPAATRSRCVPRSTISPRSTTTTRSARSAVDSRWAMLTTVRPCDTRSSASVSACSVSGSTDEVASSRMSRPGSPSWARASATSWRSPTDRLVPRSPAGAVEPTGEVVEPAAEAERGEGGAHLVVGGIRSTDPHVLADGRVEQEAVLRHHPDRRSAGRRDRRVARSTPPTRTAPVGRVGQAAQQLGDRGLARARLADHRDGGAGGEVQVDAAQHLPAAPVREPHIVEVDRERPGRRGPRRAPARPRRWGWPGRRGSCASRRWRSGSGRGSRSARRSGGAAGSRGRGTPPARRSRRPTPARGSRRPTSPWRG